MKLLSALPLLAALMLSGCHGQPVVDTTPKASVGGTIAGIVSSDANAALANRKVTATNVATGTKYNATTATNGGYTIKVPEGPTSSRSSCTRARPSPSSRIKPTSTTRTWTRIATSSLPSSAGAERRGARDSPS